MMALSLKIKIHDFRKLVVAYMISAFNTLQAVIDRLKKKSRAMQLRIFHY